MTWKVTFFDGPGLGEGDLRGGDLRVEVLLRLEEWALGGLQEAVLLEWEVLLGSAGLDLLISRSRGRSGCRRRRRTGSRRS